MPFEGQLLGSDSMVSYLRYRNIDAGDLMLCLKCLKLVKFGIYTNRKMIENGHTICWPCHLEGEEE